jgi:hypothetical protein
VSQDISTQALSKTKITERSLESLVPVVIDRNHHSPPPPKRSPENEETEPCTPKTDAAPSQLNCIADLKGGSP